MHIDKIRVEGFGRLKGTVSFQRDACNVLCQDNEFGKSTMMDAILYTLYGFPSQRARSSVLKPLDKYRPWEAPDNNFAVELELNAPDGRPMRLRADFRKSPIFELVDTRTLQPIPLEGASFGERFFRMSLPSFTECFFYRQDEREGSERNELIRKIEEAVVSHRKDEPSSVRQALVALQEVRVHLPEHSSDSVKPDTLLRRIGDSISEVRSKMERLDEDRRARATELAEAVRIDEELARLDSQRKRLEFSVAGAELDELEYRIRRREELAAALTAREARLRELEAFAGFDPSLRSKAQTAYSEWQAARQRHDAAASRSSEELRPKLAELSKRREELPSGFFELGADDCETMRGLRHRITERERLLAEEQSRMENLAAQLEGYEEPIDELESSLARLEGIDVADREQILAGDVKLAELEQQINNITQTRADAANRIQVAKTRRTQQNTLLMAVVMLALAIAMIGVVSIFTRFVFMGWGLVLLAISTAVVAAVVFSKRQKSIVQKELEPAAAEEVSAGGELQRTREQLEVVTQEFQRALTRANVSAPDLERLKRANEWRNKALPYLNVRTNVSRLKADCESGRSEAESLLAKAHGPDAATASESILERLEKSADLLANDINLRADVARHQEMLDQVEAEAVKLEQLLDSATRNLDSILVPLNGAGPKDAKEYAELAAADLTQYWEERLNHFLHACEQAARLETLRAEPPPEQPVADHELDKASQRAAYLRERIAQFSAAQPELVSQATRESRAALQDELTDTARRHEELQVQRLNLFAACDQVMETWRHDYPRLQEELARLESQRREISEFGDAVTIARRELSAISEQVYAQWASAINERINRILPQLNPRYRDVACSDKLELSLYSEDAGRRLDSRELDHLSKGARDQIKIALRIAISEYLSAHVGNLPLVFDEPFAHWDDRRFLEGMRYLATLAERHQVILLSCHHLRYDWLKEADPELAHRLNFCSLVPL